MAMEQALNFTVESVVEDVFQHGTTLSDRDLASRKAEDASLRRYEAVGWLRKTVGVVGGKDLSTEEDFMLGLHSGIIICNVLNRVELGVVHKGGKPARVVNFVLALKAYSDWKQSGGIGSFKYGGGPMKPTSGNHFVRKNSESFMNSFSRTSSANEDTFGLDINEAEVIEVDDW